MFAEYALFLAKIFTVLIAVLLAVMAIAAITSKSNKHRHKDKMDIKKLNERFESMEKALREKILLKNDYKSYIKQEKLAHKETKKSPEARKRIFVLTFIGDIRATGVKHLRDEISALLTVATPEDEVVLRLESPGGIVPGYGLAASQLKRLRAQGIPLTIAIDKVAASGGYMMAAVGDKILSAPFAIVGSIGVIAQIPNFHRLLKKNDIDFEQVMAGQYKRTLTIFGENTLQGRQKLQEEVDETQVLFKSFVQENRPQLNIDEVATGEHWYGKRALELKLVDELITSDDYLLSASKRFDIYELCFSTKKTILERFSSNAHKGLENCLSFFMKGFQV